MSAVMLAALCALTATATAQTHEETLEEKLEAKLQEPFAKNVPWVLDLDEAIRQAQESGKPIFAYFTRSFSP